MRNSIWLIGLVLAMLASSSCSMGSLGRSGSSRKADSEEVASLKAHIVELQRRSAVAEVELERLRKRLEDLEADREVDPERGGPGQAGEVTVNRAGSTSRSDEPPTRTAAGDSRVDSAAGSDLEVSELPADPAVATGGVEEGTGESLNTEQEAASSNGELTISAQALYDRGYTLFHRGRYIDSETAFQQFLRSFSATVLGDNAQFWIAEARYARGDVKGALAAYRETVTRFPEGNKLPEARLKIGDCLRELGDTEAARLSYRDVIRDHPGSAAASTARERLDRSP